MSKIDTALKATIVIGMAVVIVGQKVIIDEYENRNRKQVLITKTLQNIIEKTVDKLTPEQWIEIAPELLVDLEFTDITLKNM